MPLCLYFFITSNFFLTRMLVPYVGDLMGADFIVKYATYDPFTSYIELHDATLGEKDNVFISAKNGSGYINILSLFKNTLELRDVYFDGMDLNFVKEKNGRWSLPWLYNGSSSEDDSSEFLLDFTNVNIVTLNINFKNNLNKNSLRTELNNLILKADRFKNGLLSVIKYNGNIKIKSAETVCIDQGNISGLLSVNLDSQCIPSHVNFSSSISDLNGYLGNSRVRNRALSFKTEIKRERNGIHCYDIKTLNIKDSVNTELESYLDADGTLDFTPFKLLLKIQAGPIRTPLLATVTDLLGDFKLGNTELFYYGNLVLSLDDITSSGKLLLSDFTFTAGSYQLTNDVPLDLHLGYSLNLDFSKKIVSLEKFNSTLTVDNENILSSNLNNPFIFNYEKARLSHVEAAPVIGIKSRHLDLNLLNIFMYKNVRFFTGKLNSDLALSVDPRNNDITLKGNTNVEDLSFEINDFKPDLNTEQKLNFNIISDINFNIVDSNKIKINDFKFISRRSKDDEKSIFNLEEPFSFKFRKNKFISDRDIKIEMAVNKFHIIDIVEYIPKGFPLKLNDGYLRYKYLLTIPKTLDFIKVNGQAELLYSNFSFYGRPVNNLSISNDINAVFYDTETVKLKDCVTELYINGALGFLAKTNGKISINEKKDSNLIMSVENINKHFFDLFCTDISRNIEKIQAEGELLFDYTESNKTASIKGDFNMSEAFLGNKPMLMRKQTKITGGLKFSLVENDKEFNIDDLNLLLLKEKIKIVSLDVNGHFPLPVNKGISNLAITSDSIALDEVVKICLKLAANQDRGKANYKTKVKKKSKNKSAVVLTGEYGAIDFKGLDLKCDFMLNDIFCGDLIKSSYNGKLGIKNNKISLLNKALIVNGTDINFYGDINTGSSDGYPYKLKADFKNLDLNPLIKTFVSGEYEKTKGMVDMFSLSLQGKGFTEENMKKNFNGKLDIMLSKLSLPYQIGQFKLVYITLIPLEVLLRLREMLPGGVRIKNLKKGVDSTKNIFSNKDNIDLTTGEIRLTARNGKVNLDKIHFIGTKNDTVNYSNFSGTIGYNGKIKVKAHSDINHIKLPINIHGVVNKPVINYAVFIPKFLAKNTTNILNPMNIVNLVTDAGKGVVNTLEGAGKAIAEPFEGRSKSNELNSSTVKADNKNGARPSN